MVFFIEELSSFEVVWFVGYLVDCCDERRSIFLRNVSELNFEASDSPVVKKRGHQIRRYVFFVRNETGSRIDIFCDPRSGDPAIFFLLGTALSSK